MKNQQSKESKICPLMSNPSGFIACQPCCKFYRLGSTNYKCILMELPPEGISARAPKALQNPLGVIDVEPPSYRPLPEY